MKLETVAARQHGVISGAQAVACGLSRRQVQLRVQREEWRRIHDDVFAVAATPDSWLQRVWDAVLLGGRGALASHATAARLLGLRLPYDPGLLEITTSPRRRVRQDGIRAHRSTMILPSDRRRRDGVPCTSPSRTMVDLSSRFEAESLGSLVDDLLRRRMLTLHGLAATADRLGPAPGRDPKVVGEVLHARWAGYLPGDSDLEARIIRLLVSWGLPVPRQHLRVSVGGRRGYVDLAYPEHRVAIEVDSWRYHGDRTAFERDRIKGNALVLAGWRVLRVTELMTDQQIVDLVRAALRVCGC